MKKVWKNKCISLKVIEDEVVRSSNPINASVQCTECRCMASNNNNNENTERRSSQMEKEHLGISWKYRVANESQLDTAVWMTNSVKEDSAGLDM